MGELLKEMEKNQGAKGNQRGRGNKNVRSLMVTAQLDERPLPKGKFSVIYANSPLFC